MKYTFTHKDGFGKLILIKNESGFSINYFKQKTEYSFHTIAWNKGKCQNVFIDEVKYEFNSNTLLPIMLNQSFRFERPEDIIAWQFNREFYCILNHDAEVGCIGFIFFGPSPTMFVSLEEEDTDKLKKLQDLFEEEYE